MEVLFALGLIAIVVLVILAFRKVHDFVKITNNEIERHKIYLENLENGVEMANEKIDEIRYRYIDQIVTEVKGLRSSFGDSKAHLKRKIYILEGAVEKLTQFLLLDIDGIEEEDDEKE